MVEMKFQEERVTLKNMAD